MIPLGIHSHFSMMESTIEPRTLCRYAKKMGYNSLNITDTNNLHGLWSILTACREENITPIIGAEARTESIRLFCLVKDRAGYTNLCRLLSKRHCDTDFDLYHALETLHQGLLLLATDQATLAHCLDIGADTVAGLTGFPNTHNSSLRKYALTRKTSAVLVADTFLLASEDYHLHRLLRAIRTNARLSRHKETVVPPLWLASPKQYQERFSVWPEVVENTETLGKRCTFRSPEFGLVLPPYGQELEERQADSLLHQAAHEGARLRYGSPLPLAVTRRLAHELEIIAAMRFSSYFLVVRDIVRPVSRTCGRGSGAASLVAYCLFITNVCPIKHTLYFERFLNPGRTDAPDIDIDFAWDERDQVIANLLGEKKNHAAMVCNHVSLQPRMAIRETAKVFGLPAGEISAVTKRLPWIWRSRSNQQGYYAYLQTLPQLRDVDLSQPWPQVLHLAERISGIPRNLSVHPGGVVITPNPICEYVPVQKAGKGVPIIQWEKDGAEEAGLVKIDLLGNRSLGVIRDTITQVQAHSPDFSEQAWEPEDDQATRKTVARGDTMGCFYIESPATRLLQKRSRHGDFSHLVIHSSIIRPAANEFIREYLRRLHGGNWEPLHPIIAGVLDETYGIMVYQEDVSRVAVQFGFSHADADRLRKIMSKKDKEKKLIDFQEQFFTRGREKKVSREICEKIWQMMMSFDGYSFCKPHSASYARVSFQAAYLKTHFPAEFMAAVISNQGGFYSTFAYVSEARRLGLSILEPDINTSARQWTGKGKTLRVGLMAIKGLSQKSIEKIIEKQQQGGFDSMMHFLHQVQPEADEATGCIQSGALDNLVVKEGQQEINRGQLCWLLAFWLKKRHSPAQQLFNTSPTPPPLPPEEPLQRLRREYRCLGFLCSLHPITLFSTQRQRARAIRARDIERYKNSKQPVCFLGWLITGKIIGTKTGAPMEFLTFEDETGLVECTLFPKVYDRYCHLLHSKGPLLLEGYVEEDFGACTLTVQRVAGGQANFSFSQASTSRMSSGK